MLSTKKIKALVDRAAELDALVGPLAAELKAIKDALKAEGDGTYKGSAYDLIVATTDTTTLDSAKVKATLTPAQLIECSRAGTRTDVRLKARAAALKIAA